jgi:hypothetical protein
MVGREGGRREQRLMRPRAQDKYSLEDGRFGGDRAM